MLPDEWEPIYKEILDDFGYDRSSDENSARMLKAVMMNSCLISEDEVAIKRNVTVFGNSNDLEVDIGAAAPKGTLIASGSSVGRMMDLGITPDIIVTDLDGDIDPQIKASRNGAVTFIHAHGDNSELVQRYAHEFIGPVILTTQSKPDNIICNFGGFTDGDRAVCIARHFGAKEILLLGFDFDTPSDKDGSDPKTKARKLQWAKRIIFEHNEPGVSITVPS
ncbi:MAG: DUF115 domain-containing protein [Candidatus Methanoplasma sp.]|jgi:uncharacterized Rossmann fold enzyme|nr:DUF115 domain-containing protein [Candidatus Methanoplasma sp.]